MIADLSKIEKRQKKRCMIWKAAYVGFDETVRMVIEESELYINTKQSSGSIGTASAEVLNSKCERLSEVHLYGLQDPSKEIAVNML